MKDTIQLKDIKKVNIEFIPHKNQRYETSGDYWIDDDDTIQFRISIFENPFYALYILIHEIAEFWRVMRKGISVKDIDKFDMDHPELDDPGMSMEAPYHDEHMRSITIERIMYMQDGGTDFEEYYNSEPIRE